MTTLSKLVFCFPDVVEVGTRALVGGSSRAKKDLAELSGGGATALGGATMGNRGGATAVGGATKGNLRPPVKYADDDDEEEVELSEVRSYTFGSTELGHP